MRMLQRKKVMANFVGRRNNEVVASNPRNEEEAPEAGDRETVEIFIENMQRESLVRFSSKQVAAFTWNYSTKLGAGAFGVVYKGEFPNGVQLAVKVLKYNNNVDKMMEVQFMAEVSTIGRTHHRNLVRLYGFCFDARTKALVYEYMENGSLDRLLFGNDHRIEWEKLYEIAVGAAKGLEYLHHYGHKRIIHHDIKPCNVLLDSNLCPKLAELSCPTSIAHMKTCRVLGALQDMLPQRFGRHFQLLTKLEEILADKEIEGKDLVKAKTMCMVALFCVQYIPEARPSMIDVVKMLEGGVQVTPPPNPFQYWLVSTVPPYTQSSTSTTSDGTTENCPIQFMIKHEKEEVFSAR
ncbi:hypothetical protein AAG906_016894 [Vitis piasezkii]